MKIAAITPIDHIDGLVDLVKSKGDYYDLQNSKFSTIRWFLIHDKIDTLICNPNKQDYIIGEELLRDTNVKLINSCSTGTNHIDLDYCKSVGIEVYSLKNDYELINDLPSTAELAFGLMLSLLRHIPEAQNDVCNGCWDYSKFIGRQVKGLRIGIVGAGRLGKMMYDYCQAFGACPIVYDPYKMECGVWRTNLNNLFQICDVISLHVHVTPETKYMVNHQLLNECNKKPYIINTSRGEIVNETDIVEALIAGTISGYAADVVEDEFGSFLWDSPIINAMKHGENIIVTPHIGGMTFEGQKKAYEWAINKL